MEGGRGKRGGVGTVDMLSGQEVAGKMYVRLVPTDRAFCRFLAQAAGIKVRTSEYLTCARSPGIIRLQELRTAAQAEPVDSPQAGLWMDSAVSRPPKKFSMGDAPRRDPDHEPLRLVLQTAPGDVPLHVLGAWRAQDNLWIQLDED